MNTHLVSLAAAVVIGLLLGALIHSAWRRHQQRVAPLSLDGLAERADVNGQALVNIARAMRATARDEQREVRRQSLLHWAITCENAARDHLSCINAISLESLQRVTDTPVHLGDFNPAGGDRRKGIPQESFPRMLLRRARHG